MGRRQRSEIEEITDRLIAFRDARNWEQFHNSKDLALALSIEAAELNELFLWKNAEDVDVDRLREELADVLIFCFLLAAKHRLEIREIILDKIKRNEEKYPVDLARNSSRKCSEL